MSYPSDPVETRGPEQQDWIERIRSHPPMEMPLDLPYPRTALWPLICDVVEAAGALYELVEMNESVGRCLDSRAESLMAGQKLAALRAEVERDA